MRKEEARMKEREKGKGWQSERSETGWRKKKLKGSPRRTWAVVVVGHPVALAIPCLSPLDGLHFGRMERMHGRPAGAQ